MVWQQAVLRAALWSLQASGLHRVVEGRLAGIGGILAFHRIHQHQAGELESEHRSVSPPHFEALIRTLLGRGYTFLSMSGMVERLSQADRSSTKVVCLTFDDGYADTYETAFPICREHRVPMTVYLATGMIRRTFPMWEFALEAAVRRNDRIEVWCPGGIVRRSGRTSTEKRRAYLTLKARLAMASPADVARTCSEIAARYGIDPMAAGEGKVLTARMIAEMQASGLVEFGAHTVHHTRLANLCAGEARWEIEQSKRDCETLTGVPARHFAYPYGDAKASGPREIAYCRELGFASAVTTRSNTVFHSDGDRLLELPRLSYNGLLRNVCSVDLMLSGTLPILKRQWDAYRLSRIP